MRSEMLAWLGVGVVEEAVALGSCRDGRQTLALLPAQVSPLSSCLTATTSSWHTPASQRTASHRRKGELGQEDTDASPEAAVRKGWAPGVLAGVGTHRASIPILAGSQRGTDLLKIMQQLPGCCQVHKLRDRITPFFS